jgi:drug/metabolite transporter (DMT)-like permease
VIVVALALLASFGWGSSDFAGGRLTRAVPMPAVLVLSQLAGLIVLGCVVAASGQAPPAWDRLVLALAAGVLGTIELGLLYLAISRGPVIVVAPVAAAGAVLPVMAGALEGNHLGIVAVLGIVCALAGACAAAWDSGNGQVASGRHIGSSTLLAAIAAVAIGGLFILFDRAAAASPVWAAAGVRAGGLGGAATLLLIPSVRRQIVTPRPTGLVAAMVGVGLLDAGGDLSFAFASAHGQLAVVAVLASLYPVVTVLLAAGLLHERVRPLQAIGALVALGGVAILGAA